MFNQKTWLEQQKENLPRLLSCAELGRGTRGQTRWGWRAEDGWAERRGDGIAMASVVVWKTWIKEEGRAQGHFQNSIWMTAKENSLKLRRILFLSFFSTTLLLLLQSRISCVRPCATPWTAAHQTPLSLGFSRQEHWSGLPFPSPMHESEKWKWSRSVVADSLRPHGLQPTRLLHPLDSPGESTGVGCHCLLHSITLLFHATVPQFWPHLLILPLALTLHQPHQAACYS